MQNFRRWNRVTTACSIFFLLTVSFPVNARELTLETTKGLTTVIRQGQSYRGRPGTLLREGDQLLNSTTAGIQLDLAQGRVILTGSTRVEILILTSYRGGARTTLRLHRGNLWTSLRRFINKNSLFRVFGPQGTIYNIRGTEFSASTDGEINIVTVSQGGVQAENPQGGVFIAPGFGSAIAPGQAPMQPRPIIAIATIEEIKRQRVGPYWRISGRVSRFDQIIGTSFKVTQPIEQAKLTLNGLPVPLDDENQFAISIKPAIAKGNLPLLGNETVLSGSVDGQKFRVPLQFLAP